MVTAWEAEDKGVASQDKEMKDLPNNQFIVAKDKVLDEKVAEVLLQWAPERWKCNSRGIQIKTSLKIFDGKEYSEVNNEIPKASTYLPCNFDTKKYSDDDPEAEKKIDC